MDKEQIAQYAEQLLSIYERMNASQKKQYAPLVKEAIEAFKERLQTSQEPVTQETQTEPSTPNVGIQVPEIARELWTLSRGDPDVFALYVNTYPDPNVRAIGRIPGALDKVMNEINNTQSERPPGQVDGVPQAPLQSSNVYGYRYDPIQKKLKVRFQNGSVYSYDQVPKMIFDAFSQGSGVARTTGKNKFGRWWTSKSPSLGASVHQILIAGKFPYQKIK